MRFTPSINLLVSHQSRYRSKSSEQLLSSDTHSNTANYKFTYSVEITPICKDDLVCIPLKQARSLSNIAPLTICTRVGNSLHVLDPATLQSADVSAQVYWRTPFEALATVTDLVEFTVLDVEPSGPVKGKWVLADAQVALNGAFRSSAANDDGMDFEEDGGLDQIYHTRTHLGAILQPGDNVLGYHLSRANFNSDDYASLPTDRIPDVILIKKTYPNRRKKNKPRSWKLKSMAKEAEEGIVGDSSRGVVGRMGGRDQKKVEEDYELFLRDIEEDEEMRTAVNLYKAPGAGSGMAGGKTRRKGASQFAMDTDEPEGPPEQAIQTVVMDAGENGPEEDEPDFPEVKLDELLDDFDEMTLGEEHGEPEGTS